MLNAQVSDNLIADDIAQKYADELAYLDDNEKQLWLQSYTTAFEETQDEKKSIHFAQGAVRRSRVDSYIGVKSYTPEGDPIIEGWGMKFTDADNLDLDGEYFSADDIEALLLDYYEHAPLHYEHGQDADYGVTPIGKRFKVTVHKIGLWVEHTLDASHKYFKRTMKEIADGLLAYSVDSVPQYSDGDTDGRLRWGAIAWALTKNPAEPGLNAVALKSIIKRATTEAREARGAENTLFNHMEKSEMEITEEKGIEDEVLDSEEIEAVIDDKSDDGIKNADEVQAYIEALSTALETGDMDAVQETASMLSDYLDSYQDMMEDAEMVDSEVDNEDEDEKMEDDEMGDVKATLTRIQELLASTPDNTPLPQKRTAKNGKSRNLTTFNINKMEDQPEVGIADLIQVSAGFAPSSLRGKRVKDPVGYTMKKATRQVGSNRAKSSLSGQSGIGGGYWVSTAISDDIIKPLYTDTVMMRAGAKRRDLPTGIRSMEIRRWDNTTVARFGGEGDTTTESRPDTDFVTLELKKVVVETILTEEEVEFGGAGLESHVREDQRQKAMILIDNSSLRGDGTKRTGDKASQFVGLRHNVNASELTTFSPMRFVKTTDLTDLITQIKKRDVPQGDNWSWVWNHDIHNQVSNFTDNLGRPLLSQYAEASEERFRGIRSYSTNQIPSDLGSGNNETEIYCGDFSYVTMSISSDLNIVVDRSVLVRSGEILVRGTFYAGVVVTRPEAFQIITNAKAV